MARLSRFFVRSILRISQSSKLPHVVRGNSSKFLVIATLTFLVLATTSVIIEDSDATLYYETEGYCDVCIYEDHAQELSKTATNWFPWSINMRGNTMLIYGGNISTDKAITFGSKVKDAITGELVGIPGTVVLAKDSKLDNWQYNSCSLTIDENLVFHVAGELNGTNKGIINYGTIIVSGKMLGKIENHGTIVVVDGGSISGTLTNKDGGRLIALDGSTNSTSVSASTGYDGKTACSITFDHGDGTSDSKSQFAGWKIDTPEDPIWEEHEFQGWYLGDDLWDFESYVTKDMTLQAKWISLEQPDRTVAFIPGNGDPDFSVVVSNGQTVSAPEDPTWKGYDFQGWYLGNTKWDFSSPVTGDMQLTAKWTVAKHTVTIDTGTGPIIFEPEEVEEGKTITLPSGRDSDGNVIKNEGKTLVGWETTDGSGSKTTQSLGSDYKVESDVTVTPVWVEDPTVLVYTLTDGGSMEGKTYEVLDGDTTISLKNEGVTKEGYRFIGWRTPDEPSVAYAPGLTLIASETTYMEAYLVPITDDLCEIIYDPADGTTNVEFQFIEQGNRVWLPTALDMHREGYEFIGWATTNVETDSTTTGALSTSVVIGSDGLEGTLIETPDYLVTKNETLVAVWSEKEPDTPQPPIFIVVPDTDPEPIVIVPPHEESEPWLGKNAKTVLLIGVIAAIIGELAILTVSRHR